MSIIRKYRNHTLQTNPQHREEEPRNTNCVSRRLHNLVYLNVIPIQQIKIHIVLEKYDRMFFIDNWVITYNIMMDQYSKSADQTTW